MGDAVASGAGAPRNQSLRAQAYRHRVLPGNTRQQQVGTYKRINESSQNERRMMRPEVAPTSGNHKLMMRPDGLSRQAQTQRTPTSDETSVAARGDPGVTPFQPRCEEPSHTTIRQDSRPARPFPIYSPP